MKSKELYVNKYNLKSHHMNCMLKHIEESLVS